MSCMEFDWGQRKSVSNDDEDDDDMWGLGLSVSIASNLTLSTRAADLRTVALSPSQPAAYAALT